MTLREAHSTKQIKLFDERILIRSWTQISEIDECDFIFFFTKTPNARELRTMCMIHVKSRTSKFTGPKIWRLSRTAIFSDRTYWMRRPMRPTSVRDKCRITKAGDARLSVPMNPRLRRESAIWHFKLSKSSPHWGDRETERRAIRITSSVTEIELPQRDGNNYRTSGYRNAHLRVNSAFRCALLWRCKTPPYILPPVGNAPKYRYVFYRRTLRRREDGIGPLSRKLPPEERWRSNVTLAEFEISPTGRRRGIPPPFADYDKWQRGDFCAPRKLPIDSRTPSPRRVAAVAFREHIAHRTARSGGKKTRCRHVASRKDGWDVSITNEKSAEISGFLCRYEADFVDQDRFNNTPSMPVMKLRGVPRNWVNEYLRWKVGRVWKI